MVSNCRPSQFAYPPPVKVDDKKDKAKVRGCLLPWPFCSIQSIYVQCIHLLCCTTARPCLCRPPLLFHAQYPSPCCPPRPSRAPLGNPSTPLPLFLLLPSLQLPTAVLSTTARAKARAAKKAKEAGKEPEAAAEAMDTDKPAGEAAAEGAAAAGEGGEDKPEGGEAKKEPEPTSFTGGCMPNTSRA